MVQRLAQELWIPTPAPTHEPGEAARRIERVEALLLLLMTSLFGSVTAQVQAAMSFDPNWTPLISATCPVSSSCSVTKTNSKVACRHHQSVCFLRPKGGQQ